MAKLFLGIEILQAILIVLRIVGTIQCSWWVVFLPTGIYLAILVMALIAALWLLAVEGSGQ